MLFYLRSKFTGSEDYPTVASDAGTILLKGSIGLMVMVAFRLFVGKETTNFIGAVKTPIEKYFYAILSYFAIQIVIILISGAIFQVAQVDVYAFYISAGIMEELLYRGALVMIVQFLLAKFTETHKYPALWGITVFTAMISGIVFAAVHTRYWGNITMLAITFLGGVSQAIWYQHTKNLTVPILAHAVINFVASGSLLQTLGG